MVSHLQMRKGKVREVTSLAEDNIASKVAALPLSTRSVSLVLPHGMCNIFH